MKKIKFTLALLIAFTFSNCNNDNDNTVAPLDFTLNNVIGTYGVNSYNADLTNTANTQGTDVTISTAVKVGDTFQIDLVLNSNGTFSAQGEYRVRTTVTPVQGSQTFMEEILLINNAGNFSISTSGPRIITFTATSGDFLNGEYSVNFFNQEGITLIQDKSETAGNISTQTVTTIAFGKN